MEQRVVVGNGAIRLDFDPRTSDTMYNYIWLRRPTTEPWLRVHNFGIDVRSWRRGQPEELANTVGMHLDVAAEGRRAVVTYPSPLYEYIQVADAPSLAAIHNYPDIPRDYGDFLPGVCDAALAFTYEVDESRPSFVVSGKVLSGRVYNAVYIIDALWTDNHQLPTHVYCEGMTPLENHVVGPPGRLALVENVAYFVFYRDDGLGVPLALLPLRPDRSVLCNHYDNSWCLSKFRLASTNQAFVPDGPPVTGATDCGYEAEPDPDGAIRGVRVAFLPELGWGVGGTGFALLERIKAAIAANYLDVTRTWRRRERNARVLWTWNAEPPC